MVRAHPTVPAITIACIKIEDPPKSLSEDFSECELVSTPPTRKPIKSPASEPGFSLMFFRLDHSAFVIGRIDHF